MIALFAIVGHRAERLAKQAKQLAPAWRCRCEHELGGAINRAPEARLIFLTRGATTA
jgi:hypothetical protein